MKSITKTELIDSIMRLDQINELNEQFDESTNYEIVNSIAIMHFGNELTASGDFENLIKQIDKSRLNN